MAKADVMNFLGVFDGGARPNRYRVTIVNPQMSISPALNTNIQFLCRSTSIPASIMGVAPVHFMGREVKIAGDRTFDDWSVTIYNNKSFDLRKAFENWSSNMLKNFGNVEDGSIDDETKYMSRGIVEQLDRKDEKIQTYKVEGIWPITVGDIALAYDSNNTVEEFQVTFAVNWWESDSTDKGTDLGGATT